MKHTTPALGEVWMLDCGEILLPVLLLADELDDELDDVGEHAVDVVPVWIDVDFPGPSDLILTSQDTTTGRVWRLAFRLQTVVDRRRITRCDGALTPPGRAVVENAVATGYLPPERTGPLLESCYEKRNDDEWLAAILSPCVLGPD